MAMTDKKRSERTRKNNPSHRNCVCTCCNWDDEDGQTVVKVEKVEKSVSSKREIFTTPKMGEYVQQKEKRGIIKTPKMEEYVQQKEKKREIFKTPKMEEYVQQKEKKNKRGRPKKENFKLSQIRRENVTTTVKSRGRPPKNAIKLEKLDYTQINKFPSPPLPPSGTTIKTSQNLVKSRGRPPKSIKSFKREEEKVNLPQSSSNNNNFKNSLPSTTPSTSSTTIITTSTSTTTITTTSVTVQSQISENSFSGRQRKTPKRFIEEDELPQRLKGPPKKLKIQEIAQKIMTAKVRPEKVHTLTPKVHTPLARKTIVTKVEEPEEEDDYEFLYEEDEHYEDEEEENYDDVEILNEDEEEEEEEEIYSDPDDYEDEDDNDDDLQMESQDPTAMNNNFHSDDPSSVTLDFRLSFHDGDEHVLNGDERVIPVQNGGGGLEMDKIILDDLTASPPWPGHALKINELQPIILEPLPSSSPWQSLESDSEASVNVTTLEPWSVSSSTLGLPESQTLSTPEHWEPEVEQIQIQGNLNEQAYGIVISTPKKQQQPPPQQFVSMTTTTIPTLPVRTVVEKKIVSQTQKTKQRQFSGGKVPERIESDDTFAHINVLINGDDPPIYECTVCNKKFRTKAHRKYHRFCSDNGKHDNNMPFKCSLCGRGFISRGHYEYHLDTHQKKRKSSR